MRVTPIAALVGLTLVAGGSHASACDLLVSNCLPSVVVWPVATEAGLPLGAIEARVRPLPHFEMGAGNGQPVTVLYNNPASLPGSVDPYLHLVALPHVKRSTTLGGYPVGY